MSENKGFTIIQNEIINSGKVSLKAMGLFLYLKSKPKDWRFSTLRIQKDFSDGLFAIRKAMKELEEVGLLERKKTKNEKGQFEINYIFNETVSENPTTEKPKSEKPKSEIKKPSSRVRKSADGKTNDGKTEIGNPNNKKKNEEVKKKKEKIIQEEVSLSGESGIFPEEPKTPSASNDDGKLYSKMVDLYFNWFKDLNGGIPPKFGKADGSAMKQIINYFKYIHKQANNGKDEVEEVILMFTYILTNWAKIDPFLQKQTKLIQINGNIQNIINDLKNGKRNSTSKSDKSEHARTSRVQDAFGKIDDIFNSKK